MGDIEEKTEYRTCEKHGDYECKVSFLLGRQFRTRCSKCSEEEEVIKKEERDREEKLKKQREIERLLGKSDIPPKFLSRTFDNYRAETKGQRAALDLCRSMAENFDNCMAHGTSLLMTGKPGTGKNHLSSAFAIEVIKQGRSARYTTVLRAVRMIKSTYRKDSEITEQKAINMFIWPDLLIIDEIGIQFGSDTEKMYLFEIINGRYENQRPTILISNLSQSEINEYLGERIMDRLNEGGGGSLIFDWGSYRGRVANDENLKSVTIQVKPDEKYKDL